jgi:hypothetical protein
MVFLSLEKNKVHQINMKRIILLCSFLLSSLFTNAQNIENYIADNAPIAQNLMRDHKIPASLILAIAIHESAAGTSKIARYLNNHFGIKGPNNNEEIRSSYRDYSSSEESYNHFAEFLLTRTPYKAFFDKYDQYDFKGWARAIQRSGYAHSRTWASQVIGLINKYNLSGYDNRPDDYVEPLYARAPINRKKTKTVAKTPIYTVKTGDNLSTIAKKLGTTVNTLKHKNHLKSNSLKPGQKIKH